MAAAPKDEAEAAVEEAPAAKAKRYVVVRSFTGYMHSQLLSFEAGVELDRNVGEYFIERAGGDVEVLED